MRPLAAIAMIAIPLQAQALSCLPQSIEETYARAAEAQARYVIVRGALDFDPSLVPDMDFTRQETIPPLTRIDAVLRGKALTSAGFSIPFDRRVTLEVVCYGPWCANPPVGSDVLAFVEEREDGFVLETNPCGGYLFDTPKPALIRKLRACFTGESCAPLELR